MQVGKKGEKRVVITMNGKFLPHVEQIADENTDRALESGRVGLCSDTFSPKDTCACNFRDPWGSSIEGSFVRITGNAFVQQLLLCTWRVSRG